MTPGLLIIFSGLPGSGKSTLGKMLAQHLKATYLRIDTVEQGLRDVCGITEVEGMGYGLSYRMAQENLPLGNTVIADSVNPWELTRDEWNRVATEVRARFIDVEVCCTDKREHQERIEGRGPSVPGLKPPTWKDVVERDYHPWTRDRIVIDTKGKTPQLSLQELLSQIASFTKEEGPPYEN